MADAKIGRWWRADDDDVGKTLVNTIRHIRTLSRPRLERDKKFARLYCGDVSGNGEDAMSMWKRDNPQFNMIKQAVDTMVSLITPQRYIPKYVITEGEFSLQRTGRLRTRVLEGQSYDMRLPEKMKAGFLNAAILGHGHIIGCLNEKDEPDIECALPGEMLVDPRSAISGKIWDIYRLRGIAKDALVEQYPDSEHDIRNASAPVDSDQSVLFLPRDRTLDEAAVYEGWYWGPGKGRHVIALSNCVLVDEEWEWGNPTVSIRYQRRQLGYWGLGLAEIGCDSQARLDDLLTRITECSQIGTTVWMLLDKRAKVRPEKLSNRPMTLVHYEGTGNPPQLQVFNATPPELFAEVDRIRERFLAETGISTMAAESKKPAGITSAPGQRTFEDLTSKRHQPVADEWKIAWQESYELLERMNARAQKAKNDYSVNARTQRGLVPLNRLVKWSDVDLPPEKYRLSMLMTSDLPYQVAGRLEALSEYIASGLVTRPTAQKESIDGPDDSLQRLELADLDWAFFQLEEMLEGRDAEPEPYQNVQVAADVVRRAYLTVKSQGAPEETLTKLRAFVDKCLPPVAQAAPGALPSAPAANVGLTPSQAADSAPPPQAA